jgi:hypothetical protein
VGVEDEVKALGGQIGADVEEAAVLWGVEEFLGDAGEVRGPGGAGCVDAEQVWGEAELLAGELCDVWGLGESELRGLGSASGEGAE